MRLSDAWLGAEIYNILLNCLFLLVVFSKFITISTICGGFEN